MNESGWIIGIDLCRDYTQLSYFDREKNDVLSLSIDGQSHIPSILVRGNEGWLFGLEAARAYAEGVGEEINVLEKGDPELIHIYLRLITEALKAGASGDIASLCITSPEKEAFENIGKAAAMLTGDEGSFSVQSHLLCYEYYAMSTRREIRNRDMGLFEYGDEGLSYTQLFLTGNAPIFIQSEHRDMEEFLGSGSISEKNDEEKDQGFLKAIKSIASLGNISTFYLTGNGFDDSYEGSSWLGDSLRELCMGRRQVFVGQNLFAMGACYGSLYTCYPDRRPAFISADTELSIYEVMIPVRYGSREGLISLLPAQQPRPFLKGSASVILTGSRDITLYVRNVLSGEVKSIRLEPGDLPDRPERTLRLLVSAGYVEGDICRITLRDTGFGELFPATDYFRSLDIDLAEDSDNKTGEMVMEAAPYDRTALRMKLPGIRMYSTDELSWFIADNVYMLSEDFFGEELFLWLEKKAVSEEVIRTLRRGAENKRQSSELLRTMLTSFGYLSSSEIASVCSAVSQLDKRSHLEQSRIKADGLCRYGNYLEALKLYHHTSINMDREKGASDTFKADTWHNMAVCLMYLHDDAAASDCMYRAYKCGKDKDSMIEYICILMLSGRTEEIDSIMEKEKPGERVRDKASELYKSACKAYNDSGRSLGLTTGLALKDVPESPAYSRYIDSYLAVQCRRYGLNLNRSC